MTTSKKRLAYIPALDGLRAFAVLAVLAYHSETVLSVLPGGIGGVDVFFVISGFVITRGLRQEQTSTGRIALGQFYGRRAIRLFPALLLTVVVTAPIWWALTAPGLAFAIETAGALTYLTPVTNVLLDKLDIYSHTWTLGIEEYFYLALPFVLLYAVARRMGRRGLVRLFMSIGLAMLLTIAVARLVTDAPHAVLNYYLRAGGLFLGCAAAVRLEYRRPPRGVQTWSILGVAGIVVGMGVLGVPIVGGFGFALIDLSTMAVIFAVASSRESFVRSVLELRPVTYIGRISYELYLWHLPLLAIAFVLMPSSPWVPLIAYALTLGAAVATHHGMAPLQRAARRRLASLRSRRAEGLQATAPQL